MVATARHHQALVVHMLRITRLFGVYNGGEDTAKTCALLNGCITRASIYSVSVTSQHKSRGAENHAKDAVTGGHRRWQHFVVAAHVMHEPRS